MGYCEVDFGGKSWWRALLAEVISTALLVWLGCAPLVPVAGAGTVVLTHPAFVFGFITLANVCAFGEISGALMNPAVTLGAVIYGQLKLLPALAYVIAQLLGSVIGFGGLKATSPPELMVGGVGATIPGKGVSPIAAMVIEAVITGTLVLVVCSVWASNDKPDNTAALKIGLVVAGLVFAAGPATGASLNPARSFGPAVMHSMWKHHWVYWAGPLLGGALAALLYRYVLTPPRITTRPITTTTSNLTPLNDKP